MKRLFLLLTLCAPLALLAAPPQVGQPLPELALEDQHGKAWRVGVDTRLLLFASGRKGSNLVQEVLAAQPRGFLDLRQALYLADMSRMPGFVTRTFALPALREMPFAVGVVLDDKLLPDWPRQADAVLLISLQAGRVAAIATAQDAAQLRAALGLAP
jgi:hypothetical protein